MFTFLVKKNYQGVKKKKTKNYDQNFSTKCHHSETGGWG